MTISLLVKNRRATATLELVMITPLLVTMMALVFTLGQAMIKASLTVTEARTAAWSKRSRGNTAEVFNIGPSSTRQTLAKEEAQKAVTAPTPLGSFPSVKARHTVMVGAWDYRDIDLNHSPSWQTYRKFAGGLTGTLSDAGSLLSGGLRSAFDGLSGAWQGALSTMQGNQNQHQRQSDEGKEKVKRQADEKRAEQQAEIDKLKSETIPRLEGDMSSANDNINRTIDSKAKDKDQARASAARLEKAHMAAEENDSPLVKSAFEKEVKQLSDELAKIDPQLPAAVVKKADAENELNVRRDELKKREEALKS